MDLLAYNKDLFHLQSTTSHYLRYHTTLFKVPHHPLQSTTPPSTDIYMYMRFIWWGITKQRIGVRRGVHWYFEEGCMVL